MNHATPQSLPSLAHPLIVAHAEGVENNQELLPHQRLPFPEFDPNWQGFTFCPLRFVGVKGPIEEKKRFRINTDHESFHYWLSKSPYGQLIKHAMIRLYVTINSAFGEESQEPIRVPFKSLLEQPWENLRITPGESWKNQLQKQATLVFQLTSMSALVEEVFAVRSSLLYARGDGLIDSKECQHRILSYKKEYRKGIPWFPPAYDVFDFIARQIGKTAADAMIYSVCGTLRPDQAFLDILAMLFKRSSSLTDHHARWGIPDELLRWPLSPEDTDFLKSLSFGEAYDFFSKLTDGLDPDDSIYQRSLLYHEFMVALTGRYAGALLQDMKKDKLASILFGELNTALLTVYTDQIQPFFINLEGAEVDSYGSLIIVVEAIRQQLTQGIGLLCPFWIRSPGTCCNSRNRALLERVWARTCPDTSCKLWKRRGCLAQDGRAH